MVVEAVLSAIDRSREKISFQRQNNRGIQRERISQMPRIVGRTKPAILAGPFESRKTKDQMNIQAIFL
jgi:hypothetical protein